MPEGGGSDGGETEDGSETDGYDHDGHAMDSEDEDLLCYYPKFKKIKPDWKGKLLRKELSEVVKTLGNEYDEENPCLLEQYSIPYNDDGTVNESFPPACALAYNWVLHEGGGQWRPGPVRVFAHSPAAAVGDQLTSVHVARELEEAVRTRENAAVAMDAMTWQTQSNQFFEQRTQPRRGLDPVCVCRATATITRPIWFLRMIFAYDCFDDLQLSSDGPYDFCV